MTHQKCSINDDERKDTEQRDTMTVPPDQPAAMNMAKAASKPGPVSLDPSQPTTFFRLPPEIRNRVYDELATTKAPPLTGLSHGSYRLALFKNFRRVCREANSDTKFFPCRWASFTFFVLCEEQSNRIMTACGTSDDWRTAYRQYLHGRIQSLHWLESPISDKDKDKRQMLTSMRHIVVKISFGERPKNLTKKSMERTWHSDARADLQSFFRRLLTQAKALKTLSICCMGSNGRGRVKDMELLGCSIPKPARQIRINILNCSEPTARRFREVHSKKAPSLTVSEQDASRSEASTREPWNRPEADRMRIWNDIVKFEKFIEERAQYQREWQEHSDKTWNSRSGAESTTYDEEQQLHRDLE